MKTFVYLKTVSVFLEGVVNIRAILTDTTNISKINSAKKIVRKDNLFCMNKKNSYQLVDRSAA